MRTNEGLLDRAARVLKERTIERTNEGFLDRAIRVVVGVGILSLLAIGPLPGWGLAGLVGLIPLVTGLTGYCPLYVPLGIDTRGQRAVETERR